MAHECARVTDLAILIGRPHVALQILHDAKALYALRRVSIAHRAERLEPPKHNFMGKLFNLILSFEGKEVELRSNSLCFRNRVPAGRNLRVYEYEWSTQVHRCSAECTAGWDCNVKASFLR